MLFAAQSHASQAKELPLTEPSFNDSVDTTAHHSITHHSTARMTTNMATTTPFASADKRVFNIGELVEPILTHVRSGDEQNKAQVVDDMKTILRSQQINSTCRKAVQSSHHIKRLLGMLPPKVSDTTSFGIHPVFQVPAPGGATDGPLWGWRFARHAFTNSSINATSAKTLVLHVDAAAIEFYVHDKGSWRQLCWNLRGYEVDSCEIHLPGKRKGMQRFSQILELRIGGRETAGELVDAVVKRVQTECPAWRTT
ncbi:hypothetical protein CLAFUW4_12204 [Fulvia fulva]|uniref:Uncharacterized protein n=1 Tax=Passalora fulva TaxID=5499 RepID=A0A9Q8PF14_PASFU|nr:uncharacterized protein CLAFUR5_11236 [Fulvia fulva]KAK4618313.1 hypothetical protein CLAFUR4_12209 [Fulvia fulva]KAK4618689.1 hypothetical protein CLAFUR0_12220 [Fulvia fulva]UJO21268.1 hypothetical protein CLAFUR5_11236 [Fulvia fulva]WPV18686.1 hypothetical protein CLAFUW4_12204 [Fulvia fulva]WPV32908.1 hypothetical protein CLAFUW7_12211 [Fulvia fulva]